ncbi:replication-associated recombination protein A [Malacoplasma penetrans]|uniref:Predicted ATPase n=1 Tax=Malacoplasma penetrans (strain HF-2) TaxID=272633 RepID=Q8EWR1_MALP2|nr:replication-associated recombination protein A [Malacoplasma penetrans]RXY97004.1 replication-associated recombination protein A [Malacoplasma penetrans]BAC43933.1 predicted ATPase [Malacoplasma penetrans HF-2]
MKKFDEKVLVCNSFDEMICKDVIFPKDSIIINMIENNDLFSILFFGNPGVGKSASIQFILKKLNKNFYYFNSTTNNKNDLLEILELATEDNKPIIIIEEIHRLNKDKQDLLLMYLEKDMIIVLATTTENPFFKVNPAIRSRLLLYRIENINSAVLKEEVIKYLENKKVKLSNKVVEAIVEISKSDFRQIFFYLKIVLKYYQNKSDDIVLKELGKITNSLIDRRATNHYDLLSAFHKSIRGSDPNAAVYYLAQLLESGDLISVYRRLYAVVYEDIGLANSGLGPKVNAAVNASEALGLPEARIPLSQITIELCLSPKSNSAIMAIDEAIQSVNKEALSPPNHLRDAHYASAVKLNVKGYKYPHDYNFSYVEQEYLPKELKNKEFYKPNKYSQNENKFVDYWNKIKSNNKQ